MLHWGNEARRMLGRNRKLRRMLEQCNRNQKLTQRFNHKCTPKELAMKTAMYNFKSYHNPTVNLTTCQSNVSSDLIFGV